MKTIEITTTHNVTIHYTLASPWERALALVFDTIILVVGCFLLTFLVALFGGSIFGLFGFFLVLLPVILFYTLAFEVFNNGRSPGKMVLRLRVIRMDGRNAGFMDYLMRWSFRLLEIYSCFGGLALLVAFSTRFSQRLGDLLANTVVVNIGKSDRVPLDRLLALQDMKPHQISFPQVARLPESTMLLVKETLLRSREHDNEAHTKALEMLASKLQRELNVKSQPDKSVFLNTLLRDYIVLTR